MVSSLSSRHLPQARPRLVLETQKRGSFSPAASVNGGDAEVQEVGRTGLHSAMQQWGLPSGDGSALGHVAGFQKTAKPSVQVIPMLGRLRLGGPWGGGGPGALGCADRVSASTWGPPASKVASWERATRMPEERQSAQVRKRAKPWRRSCLQGQSTLCPARGHFSAGQTAWHPHRDRASGLPPQDIPDPSSHPSLAGSQGWARANVGVSRTGSGIPR